MMKMKSTQLHEMMRLQGNRKTHSKLLGCSKMEMLKASKDEVEMKMIMNKLKTIAK